MNVRDVKIFGRLTENEENFLIEKSRILNVKKGEILHSPRDLLNQVSVVLSGKLRVLKYFTNGNEQNLNVVKEGETFGESLIFAHTSYPAYITAEEDSTILDVPYETVMELFKNKRFMEHYLEEIGRKVFNLSNVIEWLLIKSVEERVMRYLCFLCRMQGSKVVYFESKQKIASDLGSVREVISRKFKVLERKKIIRVLDRHHVEVLVDFFSC